MILGNIRNMPLLTTEEYIVEIISIMIYSTRRSKSRIQSKSIIFKLPLTSMLNGEDTHSYIVGFRLGCDYLAVFIHNEVWRSQTFDIYIYELKQRQVSILGQRDHMYATLLSKSFLLSLVCCQTDPHLVDLDN